MQLSPGKFLVIRGTNRDPYLRIGEGGVVFADDVIRHSVFVIDKEDGSPIVSGDTVRVRGVEDDPYWRGIAGAIIARGTKTGATPFVIKKSGGADGDPIASGDAFRLFAGEQVLRVVEWPPARTDEPGFVITDSEGSDFVAYLIFG